MLNTKTLHLLGYASGVAGADSRSSDGPPALEKSPYLSILKEHGIQAIWKSMLKLTHESPLSKLEVVAKGCQELALQIEELVSKDQFFTVLGGDHSSAIGTWSGAAHAIREQGALGLIWIDAHMDSHTFETTPSGNIHGMPLACLLGKGDRALTTLLNPLPKLKPENVCLIGVRSFEEGEAELLDDLKVRIYFMDEVKKRGLKVVMQEALQIVTQNTARFGISLDIDAIDPTDAPGTGVAEPDGLSAKDILEVLTSFATHSNLIGVEIVEFNPHRDKDHITEKLIAEMLLALGKGKLT